ncbi:probable syndecan isoform X1 [Carya illinoinensis]|uniref:probable syndecan isoform X1 n=1 Tax=Carya illinoinensis TaxID=32201 RepID=UPI001C724F47|nr:probable syndecan isoform X1 [Carya illinoinensis]
MSPGPVVEATEPETEPLVPTTDEPRKNSEPQKDEVFVEDVKEDEKDDDEDDEDDDGEDDEKEDGDEGTINDTNYRDSVAPFLKIITCFDWRMRCKCKRGFQAEPK